MLLLCQKLLAHCFILSYVRDFSKRKTDKNTIKTGIEIGMLHHLCSTPIYLDL